MVKTREISIEIRKLIIEKRKKGESYYNIAKQFHISKSGVFDICNKYKLTGKIENLHRAGAPRRTSRQDDSLIFREIRKNPFISAPEIKNQLNLSVSTKTIKRRLNDRGVHSRVSRRKPLLSEQNKLKRLNFAKKYINKSISFWKNVIWSDESKFMLISGKQRRNVWRTKGTSLNANNITKTVKHGGGSIMVWGCFSWFGTGNLHLVDGIMKADQYIQILRENLLKSAEKMNIQDSFVFMQDNDPKHTAKKTREFLSDSNILMLDWPPQSPDLNPIENLWHLVDIENSKNNKTNQNQFYEALVHSWDNINPELLKKLVESMPRRLEAVIKANGGNTKY